MEHSGGFAISTYDESHIEDNAEERFGLRYGDAADRADMMSLGLVDAKGKITRKGWDQINDDVRRIERNSMAWLKKKFGSARDEGHDSHEDLVGTFWFDPKKLAHAEAIDMGVGERIDMVDTSFGDLGHTAFNGVSHFGGLVLGGAIQFFDIDPIAMEQIEKTLEKASKRRRARTTTAKKRPAAKKRAR